MATEEKGQPRSAELEQAIKNRIVQRTGGRIRTLEVAVTDNGIVIRGSAASYYLKQLALRGVLEVPGSAGATRIELNTQVLGSPQKADAAAAPSA